jgi:hypothetical protein
MSLEIKYLPQQYRTVYNPVEIVMLETNSTTRGYVGFAYLIDVKDGGNLLGRLRVPPTQSTGFGRFDMSGVMKSYMSSDLGLLNGISIESMFDNTNSYKDLSLQFGWIHYNGGTATISMNQTVTFPDSTTANSYNLLTFNGSLPNYRRDVVNFYDWQNTNYYLKYTNNILSRKFLTNSPPGTAVNNQYNQKVRITDEGYIYLLYDFSDTTSLLGFTVKEYRENGNLISTTSFNTPALNTFNHIRIPCSPTTLNKINSSRVSSGSLPAVSSNATSYTINLRTETSTGSEIFHFNIDTECRYETRRIEFLNSLGGFDYFNFTKVSKHSEEIERKFFQTTANDLTSTGSINYSISNREKVQYYTKSSPKMKLTSDWIDSKTYNWLLELIESPEIYLLDSYALPGEDAINLRRIPIKNINGNWEEKLDSVDKLFNLEIDLEFGMDNFRQSF